MTELNPGDVRRVSKAFTNGAGVATDPTTITVRWRHHRGTETAWVYGTDTQVVKDSVGAYHADIPITASGLYYYKFEGTGAVQAAEEGTFLAETFFESVAPSTPSGPIRLYTGTADPTTGAGVPAAIGSVYSRTLLGSESVWVKTGAADTAWVQSGSAGGAAGGALTVLGPYRVNYNDPNVGTDLLVVTTLDITGRVVNAWIERGDSASSSAWVETGGYTRHSYYVSIGPSTVASYNAVDFGPGAEPDVASGLPGSNILKRVCAINPGDELTFQAYAENGGAFIQGNADIYLLVVEMA